MKKKNINLFIILIVYISLLLPFKMHTDRIGDIVVSYDKKLYITADKSGQINIWDSSSDKIINSYNININDELYRISISPNNQLLVVGFDDGKISIININDNVSKIFDLKNNLEDNDDRFIMLKFLSNTELISYQENQDFIIFWKLISDNNIFGVNSKVVLSKKVKGPNDSRILTTKINNNNRIILSQLKNKNFVKWDIEKKTIMSLSDIFTDKNLDMRKDSNELSINQREKDIDYIYEIIKSPSQSFFKHKPYDFYDYDISPDGAKIAIATHDKGNIMIWNSLYNKEEIRFVSHNQRVNTMKFSNDGKFLATSSIDQTLKVWDVFSGNLIKTLQLEDNYITSLAYLSTNKIVCGTFNGVVKIIKLN